MFLQQRQELILKRHFAMMLSLIHDVLSGFVQLRHTDSEGAVLFLPAKEAMFREGFMHPFRRTALDKL